MMAKRVVENGEPWITSYVEADGWMIADDTSGETAKLMRCANESGSRGGRPPPRRDRWNGAKEEKIKRGGGEGCDITATIAQRCREFLKFCLRNAI